MYFLLLFITTSGKVFTPLLKAFDQIRTHSQRGVLHSFMGYSGVLSCAKLVLCETMLWLHTKQQTHNYVPHIHVLQTAKESADK